MIEDAAQAHGAHRNGVAAGTFGDMGCFSFYPGKISVGVRRRRRVVTDRPDLAETIRCLRDMGQSGRHNHVRHGFNDRMDAVQAAALGVKLRYLGQWIQDRRRIASFYDQAFEGAGDPRPAWPVGGDHAYQIYAISDQRTGISSVRGSRRSASQLASTTRSRSTSSPPTPAWAMGPADFPVSEALSAQTLSPPIYPGLPAAAVEQIARAVNELCRSMRRIGRPVIHPAIASIHHDAMRGAAIRLRLAPDQQSCALCRGRFAPPARPS